MASTKEDIAAIREAIIRQEEANKNIGQHIQVLNHSSEATVEALEKINGRLAKIENRQTRLETIILGIPTLIAVITGVLYIIGFFHG